MLPTWEQKAELAIVRHWLNTLKEVILQRSSCNGLSRLTFASEEGTSFCAPLFDHTKEWTYVYA